MLQYFNMVENAFAKLNLSLNVFPRQGEFHPIDSIVTSVDLCDVVEVNLRTDDSITVGMWFESGAPSGIDDIPLQQNTAYRAAVEFQRRFGVNGCNISVEKHIPLGAGLGGSSADAASVVYCLCKLHGVDVNSKEIYDLCAAVGSDVNFMLRGGFARLTGKGDNVERGKLQRPMYFAVTTFDKQMSSATVYQTFDKVGSNGLCDNDVLFSLLKQGNYSSAKQYYCNRLQLAAMSLSDYAKRYLDFCAQHDLHCTMTGSGSAFFVPCDTAEICTKIVNLLLSNGFTTVSCTSVSQKE